jgi:hypothetical protein
MNTLHSIRKTTVTNYSFKKEYSLSWWAEISINPCGILNINSDYGNWYAIWPDFARTDGEFIFFLQSINKEYLAEKTGQNKEFDKKGTLDSYLLSLSNLDDRQGFINNVNNQITSLNEHCTSLSEFVERMHNNCQSIMSLYDGTPPIYYMINPLFVKFWDEIWVLLINELSNQN